MIFVVLPELGFGLSCCYRGLAVEADGVVGAVLIAPVRVDDDEFRDMHICLFLWGEVQCIASLPGMMVNMDHSRKKYFRNRFNMMPSQEHDIGAAACTPRKRRLCAAAFAATSGTKKPFRGRRLS